MKNLFLSILFLLGVPINSYTQTYYNPSNRVDLTITIREAYRPVDYSKIGRDFNTMIQDELQRRENLKRYYDEIYYQTKSSVYSSTVLTSDNLVNSKILMVQSEVIRYLDIYNTLLKNGIMKPEIFESKVKNIYFTFMNNNQILLQIVQYKYNKNLELGDQTKINEHNKLYTNTLNSIEKLELNDSGDFKFILIGLIYPNNTLNSLYDFVRSSSEGGYESYKKKWENKINLEQQKYLNDKKIQEQKVKDQEKKFKEIFDYRRKTFDLRREILSKLDKKSQNEFRRKERDFILKEVKYGYPIIKDTKEIKEILKEETINFEFKEMMVVTYGRYNIDPLTLESNLSPLKFYLDIMNDYFRTKK